MLSRLYLQVAGYRFYICDRLYEWYAAVVMLLAGTFLLLPGVELTGAMRASGPSPVLLAVFFSSFGSIRAFALLANGNIPVYGPRVRAMCALAAGPVWAILAVAQFMELLNNSRLSLALPVFGGMVLAVFGGMVLAEIYSAYRATSDVGRSN